jgi:hypothetical protein
MGFEGISFSFIFMLSGPDFNGVCETEKSFGRSPSVIEFAQGSFEVHFVTGSAVTIILEREGRFGGVVVPSPHEWHINFDGFDMHCGAVAIRVLTEFGCLSKRGGKHSLKYPIGVCVLCFHLFFIDYNCIYYVVSSVFCGSVIIVVFTINAVLV